MIEVPDSTDGPIIPPRISYEIGQIYTPTGSNAVVSVYVWLNDDDPPLLFMLDPKMWRQMAIESIGVVDEKWPELRPGYIDKRSRGKGRKGLEAPVP